jgi:tetratricopeptide (TPR) repeat protein
VALSFDDLNVGVPGAEAAPISVATVVTDETRQVTPADLSAGIAAYQNAEFLAAAGLFDAALEHDPDNPAALRLRGLALVRAGRVSEALPSLARSRRLAFNEPLSHLHYGIGLREAGQHARAAAVFRRATMLAPREPACWVNFSSALLAVGRTKAARAAARRAVALAPRLADTYYALGMAEVAADNVTGARAAFLGATRLRPAFADAWVNLGLACYRLGNVPSAIRAMHGALRAVPGHGAATANLAAFQLFRGDSATSQRLLRELVARDPACVAGRINLANTRLLDDEPDEALALLEGPPPLGRDGAHWRAYRCLALLTIGLIEEGRAELDAIEHPYDAELLILWRRVLLAAHDGDAAGAEALAERLEALAADESSGFAESRIIAYFELARYHDARARPDRAFALWRAGRRLAALLQPFSRVAHADFVSASMSAFTRERPRDGARAGDIDPAPVFVVGMPRSGTTLTEHILAAHPMVHGAGERGALNQMARELAGPYEDANWVHRLAAVGASNLAEAADRYLAELHALAPDARRVVDKMPGNARLLGFAGALLPGARIIHCRRDPRDIALSIFQIRFFGMHPYAHDLADLGWYIAEHEKLMAHWREALPGRILEVSLTDWVDDFPVTLRRVLAFLDLPYDAACETFHTQDRKVRTASAQQVRQPINARGIGRWRRYASHLAPAIAELTLAGLVPASEVADPDTR